MRANHHVYGSGSSDDRREPHGGRGYGHGRLSKRPSTADDPHGRLCPSGDARIEAAAVPEGQRDA